LRHLLLIGEFELGIDDKNRLSLPSDIRKAINSDRDGDAFFLVLGRNGKPWLYPELYYEQMVFQEQPEITPEEEQLDFDHMNFALADKVTWDSQGRMLIPDKTLKRTGLGKEVTMIGSRDHLEIWNRSVLAGSPRRTSGTSSRSCNSGETSSPDTQRDGNRARLGVADDALRRAQGKASNCGWQISTGAMDCPSHDNQPRVAAVIATGCRGQFREG